MPTWLVVQAGAFFLECPLLQIRPLMGKNCDFIKMRVAMAHCGPGLAGPMRFWQVPRGVTTLKWPSDANTARGARLGIFWLEWPRLQMSPQLGTNGDFFRK